MRRAVVEAGARRQSRRPGQEPSTGPLPGARLSTGTRRGRPAVGRPPRRSSHAPSRPPPAPRRSSPSSWRLLLAPARRSGLDGRGLADPVGVWPLAPEPEVVDGLRPAGRPVRRRAPRRRPRRRARAAGARRPAGHGDLRRPARRPRRRGGRPRRDPDDLRAGRRPSVSVGDALAAGDRIGTLAARRVALLPARLPALGLDPRATTYLDPLRLVGAGPVRLLPLWRDVPAGLPSAVSAPPTRVRSGPRVRLLVGPAAAARW